MNEVHVAIHSGVIPMFPPCIVSSSMSRGYEVFTCFHKSC